MSTLLNSKGSTRVTQAELAQLPDPQPLGRYHRPVRHDYFVAQLISSLADRGYQVSQAQYAIGKQGSRLFGTLDLASTYTLSGVGGVGLAVGFRHANDQSMGYRMVAGARVFVCDNMALSGETALLSCRHTLHTDISMRIMDSVDHLVESYATLDRNLARLQTHSLEQDAAKVLIYDAFMREQVMAPQYLDRVHEWYFNAKEDAPDCAPRTLWGLNNAFTRVVKEMPSPSLAYAVGCKVGQYFGLNH